MSLIQKIREWAENRSLSKERFKQLQEDDRLQTMLEERKKSSNERELEKIREQNRQDRIKQQLEKIRKKENHDWWTANNILKGQKNILANDQFNVLNDSHLITKSKKSGKEKSLFFKW